MKRSEMIEKICNTYNDVKCGDEIMTEYLADKILIIIEEAGMLPPINTCKVITDGKGNFKHSPTERKWDDEDLISQN